MRLSGFLSSNIILPHSHPKAPKLRHSGVTQTSLRQSGSGTQSFKRRPGSQGGLPELGV